MLGADNVDCIEGSRGTDGVDADVWRDGRVSVDFLEGDG